MDGLVLGQGKGPNKKVAQQEAAKDALSKMAK
jgi:dsRNA-specific ribonuclease